MKTAVPTKVDRTRDGCRKFTMTHYRYLKVLCIASICALCAIYIFTVHFQPHHKKWKKIFFSLARLKLNSSEAINNTSVKWNTTSTQKNHTKKECPMVSLTQLETAKTSKNKIPLILHQVFIYESELVPVQYIDLLKGCRKVNHDLLYVYWTKKGAEQFIDKFHPKYKDLYRGYGQNVMKSDFIRVLILYHFGGIYADMDMECRKPFSKHIDDFHAGAIIDQERNMQSRLLHNMNFSAMNSVLIAQKKHPFFKYYLEGFRAQMGHGNVLWKTGPFYLTLAYQRWGRQNKTGMDTVHRASPSWFSPLVDAGIIFKFQEKCKGPYNKMGVIQRLGCSEWDKQGRKQDNISNIVKNSILVHKFMHLAYDQAARGVKKRVNLCKEVNIYKPLL